MQTNDHTSLSMPSCPYLRLARLTCHADWFAEWLWPDQICNGSSRLSIDKGFLCLALFSVILMNAVSSSNVLLLLPCFLGCCRLNPHPGTLVPFDQLCFLYSLIKCLYPISSHQAWELRRAFTSLMSRTPLPLSTGMCLMIWSTATASLTYHSREVSALHSFRNLL